MSRKKRGEQDIKEGMRQAVIVYWRDAALLGNEQYAADDSDIRVMPGVSVGTLVKETDEFVAICMDVFSDGVVRDDQAPYRTIGVIPKSGILSITRIDYPIWTGERQRIPVLTTLKEVKGP